MTDLVKPWSFFWRYLYIYNQHELIKLIGELYQPKEQNQYFLNASCSETCEEAIQLYRLQVKQYITPKIIKGDEIIEKAKARKTIQDYWKTTLDLHKKTDLMLLFVEFGIQYRITYDGIINHFIYYV